MRDKNTEDELDDLNLKIMKLENLIRVLSDRINRLEEKVAPLHRGRIEKEGLTVTFDGPGERSPLGKSLGDVYRERYNNSTTTEYPVKPYGGPGNMPKD